VSLLLRQGTAVVVRFGPFLDPTDGVTPVTGLISKIDDADGSPTGIWCSKNGIASAVRHATIAATTYDRNGYYLVTLDTTDTGTLGSLHLEYTEPATTCPVWANFNVITQQAWDSLFSTDLLDVHVVEFTSGAITKDAFDSDVGDADSMISVACDEALKAENLDHLVKESATFGSDVGSASIIGQLAQPAGASFSRETDSLAAMGTVNDISAAILATPGNKLATDSSGKVSLTSTESTITAISELAQGQPTATPTMKQALMLIYMALRNLGTNNGTNQTITNDSGDVIAKCPVSETGGVFTRGKLVTGP
jgi:hypothetical protein